MGREREKKSCIFQYVICFTAVLGYHHSETCQHCYGRNAGRLSDGIKTEKGESTAKRDADNGSLWPSAAWLSLSFFFIKIKETIEKLKIKYQVGLG